MQKLFSSIISRRVMKVSVSVVAFNLCSLVYAQEFPVYEHEPIVVTATRIPTTLPHIGRSVVVITRAEIESAHVQSIQDLLQYASGVDLRQRGPYGTQADVTIRGGTFEQTLILIDGIKMSDPQTGHHNLDLPLQLVDVERVEILKGHGSRLYGPNAFGGVINIITRSGEKKIIGLNSSMGDWGLFDVGILLSYPLENFRHYGSISGRKSNGYRHNTDFGIYSGYYRLIAKLSSGQADVSIGYMDKEFGANGYYSTLFENQREHTKSGFLQAGLDLANSSILFSSKVYWRRHVDDFVLNYEDPEWYHNHHETDVYGCEFQSTFDSRWGVSTFGGEIGNESIRSNNLGDHSRTRGGFFFEHQFQPVSNLFCTFGANAYCYSDWGWNVWPGIDLSFLFTESLRGHSSIGRAFRVPTYTELYYNSPANKGNSQLKPEQAWMYEAGLNWKREQAEADLTVFRREGYNLIDWVRSSPNSFWEARNIARANTNGVEIKFWFNLADLNYFPIRRVKVSYTFLDSDKEVKGLESKYVLDHLKHQLILDIEHPLAFQLQGNWKLRFEERISGEKYVLCDSQIYKKFENVKLFVRVTNLFDTDYSKVGGIPMPGRWAVAGLKFNIDWKR